MTDDLTRAVWILRTMCGRTGHAANALDRLVQEVEQNPQSMAALKSALRAVEWVLQDGNTTRGGTRPSIRYCPWCNWEQPFHAPSCVRQIALGLAAT